MKTMYMLAGGSLWDIWIQLSRMGYGHAGDLILFVFPEFFFRVLNYFFDNFFFARHATVKEYVMSHCMTRSVCSPWFITLTKTQMAYDINTWIYLNAQIFRFMHMVKCVCEKAEWTKMSGNKAITQKSLILLSFVLYLLNEIPLYYWRLTFNIMQEQMLLNSSWIMLRYPLLLSRRARSNQ